MKNFTFIKNVKGGLSITLSSYDMMLPERVFTIPYNADRIAIPEQYALGLFISGDALNAYKSGFFRVENMEELEKAASVVGFFTESINNDILSKEEIEKILTSGDSNKLEEVFARCNYVEMNSIITIAREKIDTLSKNIIDKIENACGVELEIE